MSNKSVVWETSESKNPTNPIKQNEWNSKNGKFNTTTFIAGQGSEYK